MLRRLSLTLLALLFLLSLPVQAQRRGGGKARRPPTVYTIVQLAYAAKIDSLLAAYKNYHYAGSDTLANPLYFPVFVPRALWPEALAEQSAPSWQRQTASPLVAEIYAQLCQAYAREPLSFTATPLAMRQPDASMRDELLSKPTQPKTQTKLSETTAATPAQSPTTPTTSSKETDDMGDWQIQIRRPNFWTIKGNFSLQFMQNYVSENWYKGGESHTSLQTALNVEANFNNKQKVVQSNKLEMRLGFQTSKGDELHKYKTNTDLIRLTNKIGLQAFKHWYYTGSLQTWTQFYRGLRANDHKVYSDFMSPLESVVSIGMEYKLSKKKFSLTANISPLAGDFKYVDRAYLETNFGLHEGHHTRWTYGSNVVINYHWTVMKNVSAGGRIYYFTDYDRTQIEWENNISLIINKYLSTKIFLYPRFDDGAKRKEGKSYFQFNEQLSVGLDLSF